MTRSRRSRASRRASGAASSREPPRDVNDLVLFGKVLTVVGDHRVLDRGAVYDHDGVIDAVQAESAPVPAGFSGALRVRTAGVITPGLIDLHNHLAYNTLPLWIGRDDPYKTRYQWPGAPTYQSDVSNPAQALGIAAPSAALRFAEVKAIVGGVTAIQGSPPVTLTASLHRALLAVTHST